KACRIPQAFFRATMLRRRMRGRILGVELSILLAALVFAEIGVVLRELRTDRILDWFVSLVPLIWINLSVLFLYAFVRLYFGPVPDTPPSGTLWARATLPIQVVSRGQQAARAFPGPLLGLAVMCPACASGPVSGLFLAYVAPIAFMGGSDPRPRSRGYSDSRPSC